MNVAHYSKAIAAGVSAAATVLAGYVPDSSTLGVVLAAIIAACGTVTVWAVPNAPKK